MKLRSNLFGLAIFVCLIKCAPVALAQYPSAQQIKKGGIAVLLEDFASVPKSSPIKNSSYDGPGTGGVVNQLGRVNSLLSEPKAPLSSSRLFVIDNNGLLYILDKSTKEFKAYIKFQEVFPGFTTDPGVTGGLLSIAFDPEYSKNGKFYTTHTEKVESGRSTGAQAPNASLKGYKATLSVDPTEGPVGWHGVIVEWTDTDIKNSSFDGTAREILRIGFHLYPHLICDLIFNPLAVPGHEDYRNLYVSLGDGGTGQTTGTTHLFPQQLNNLEGKILRITPDTELRPKDQISANRSYRIPSSGSDPNPFVSVREAKPEIYAYGFRNPHRMTWDAVRNIFIVNDVGLSSWEEANIVIKGGNYGYPEREGPEQLFVDRARKTGSQLSPAIAFPALDRLKIDGLTDPVTPRYPAATYSHRDGFAIGSGFVYRGKQAPNLLGKYIFNDISTGRLFYADLAEMIAGNGQQTGPAQIHELQIVYKSPYKNSTEGPANRRLYDIVADAYSNRAGAPIENAVLPGGMIPKGLLDIYAAPYGGGRADVRLAMDGEGELYVLSKSDGFIRRLRAVAISTAVPQR